MFSFLQCIFDIFRTKHFHIVCEEAEFKSWNRHLKVDMWVLDTPTSVKMTLGISLFYEFNNYLWCIQPDVQLKIHATWYFECLLLGADNEMIVSLLCTQPTV